MKKTLLAFVFTMFFLNANSQDLLEIVTNEVCDCAKSKMDKFSSEKPKNIQLELGMCIMNSVSAHETEITAKYGKVLEVDGAMEKLGRDIGLKMASICPDNLLKLAENGFGVEDEVAEAEETLSIEGKIVEIKSEQFLTVIVKDNSGRSHSMLVLTFFEDSNLLIENKIKKNDKVLIDYFDQEFYDAKAKDFRYYKVIQGIKKI